MNSLKLPQGIPYIMVDEVLNFAEGSIITNFNIKENNTLLDITNEFFSLSGLIENIAQSAYLLLDNKKNNFDNNLYIGLLVSIQNMKICKLPTINTTIVTSIKIEKQNSRSIKILSEVNTDKDSLLCTGEIILAIKKNNTAQ